MTSWANTMAANPADLNQNNFFRLVPPTPSQSTQNTMRHTSSYQPPPPLPSQQTQHTIDPRLIPAPRPVSTPHLHPAPPLASWRSQRSASISSTASNQSGLDGWSTAGGESDAGASDSDGLGATLGQMGVGDAQAGMGRVASRRAAGRAPALSIDPNLVRPRPGSGAGGSSTARPKTQGDEEMPTAKPKKKVVEKGKASPKPKKVSHARKLNADHIPRPRNAFILFRKHVVDAKLIPPSVEIRHQNVSVIVAKMWADAPLEQKERFNELAKVEKEEHLKKYPGYRYQPVYRRTNVIRRRVRKDEAEEEKCNNVAALLLQGTSGQKLEAEIKEKMQQPLASKGNKSRKTNAANELSKGALRALRAQARQQANSESDSQSQSLNSRAGSPESDGGENEQEFLSRRSSIASDLDLGLGLDGKYDLGMSQAPMGFHPAQLAQDGYQFGTAPQGSELGVGLPGYGMQGWDQAQQQQGWAYPDQTQGNMMPMNDFAYQQPSHMDPFFNYDQALPFSPTAHNFEQPFVFPLPNSNQQQNQQYANNVGAGMYGLGGGAYAEQYQQQQQQQGGGMTLAPYAPQSAKWDASFQPGGEGMPFDETLLGDFGAALMQAEETGAW